MPLGEITYRDVTSLVATGTLTTLDASSQDFMRDLALSLTTVLENMYWEMDLDLPLTINFYFPILHFPDRNIATLNPPRALVNSYTIDVSLPKDITSWTQKMATDLGEKLYEAFTEDPMFDDEMDEFDIIFELS